MSAFIDAHRDRFGVEPICRTLGVSASAYDQRATGERSARRLEDERLVEVIRQTHKQNFEAYGYRKLWKTLRRAVERAPRCQVQRLMREHGIRGAKRRGKPGRTTVPDPAAERLPDLVDRNFTAPARTGCGSAISRICAAGRARRTTASSSTCSAARSLAGSWHRPCAPTWSWTRFGWRWAHATRGADFQLIAHTDAGSQYTSHDYAQVIDDHHVLASIGSVGDAYDNALAESFVDSFKTELITDRVWRTRSQLELAVVEYVSWFNHTACTSRSVTSRRWSSKTPATPDHLRPLRGRL